MIFKFKKTISIVLLSAVTLGCGFFANATSALADTDEPTFYFTKPKQNDWNVLNIENPVINRDGAVYLPIRGLFEAMGVTMIDNPDAQENKFKCTFGKSDYELYTYKDNGQFHIGASDKGPWYQAPVIKGNMYVPVSFLQTLINRKIVIVGEKQVALLDNKPKWGHNEKGFHNQNAFWKSTFLPYQKPVVKSADVENRSAKQLYSGLAAVNGNVIVSEASKEMGVPYVWGGSTPEGFDCSGLTCYVFAKNGIQLPRTAAEQQSFAKPISLSDLQPGDLVFWGSPAYHVGIYIGNGQYIHAPQPGQNVSIGSQSCFAFTGAGRVA